MIRVCNLPGTLNTAFHRRGPGQVWKVVLAGYRPSLLLAQRPPDSRPLRPLVPLVVSVSG
jgi:hypothetical protein